MSKLYVIEDILVLNRPFALLVHLNLFANFVALSSPLSVRGVKTVRLPSLDTSTADMVILSSRKSWSLMPLVNILGIAFWAFSPVSLSVILSGILYFLPVETYSIISLRLVISLC